MSIQVASVEIGSTLNLSGFNSGLKTLERTKVQPLEVDVRLNSKSLERDRKALEATLAKPLVLTLQVDDIALLTLRRRLQRQAPYKVKVATEVDTKSVAKAQQQINRSIGNIPTIKIRVDDTALYGLNDHVELKRTHIKDINHWMALNPIKVYTDTSELDALERRDIKGKRVRVDVEYNDPGYKPATSSRHSVASATSSSKLSFDFAKPLEAQTKTLDSCIESAADKIADAIDKGFKSQKKGLLSEIGTGLLMGATFSGGQAIYEKAAGKVKRTVGQQKEQRSAYAALSYKTKLVVDKEPVRLKQQAERLKREIAEAKEAQKLRQEMLQMSNKDVIQPLAKKEGVKATTKKQAVDGLLKKQPPQALKTQLPYIDNIRQEAAKTSEQLSKLTAEQLKVQLSDTTKRLRTNLKSITGTTNVAGVSQLGNEIEKEYQTVIALLSQATEEDAKKVLQSAKLQIAKIRKATSNEAQNIALGNVNIQKNSQQQFLKRAAKPKYSAIYQAKEVLNKGVASAGRLGGQIANVPNYAVQQISNENLSKQADKAANKVRQDFLNTADYWNVGSQDLQGVEGLRDTLAEIANLVGDIAEPDLIKANLQPLIADFKELTKSIDKYKQAITEKGAERFLTEDLVQDASKFSGIRSVVSEGLKRRTKRKAVKAADLIRANYRPSQSDEFSADSENIFAAGGFHSQEGRGSEDFAEKLRIATLGQNLKVHPIINRHSDLATPEASQENLQRNVLRGDFNPDDIAMAQKAYAAWMKNQKTQMLAGYSGGGYNVQGAGAILDQLGVPWKGVGIGTPNLGISRGVGKNYQAVGLSRDKLITEEVNKARAAGFNAGPDKEFSGRTHAVQEYLATGGDFIVEHLTGQKPAVKNSMSSYKASDYAATAKSINEWLNDLIDLEKSDKLSAADLPVVKEGFDNFIKKYEALPWDKLSSELKQRYSPDAKNIAGDLGKLSELIKRIKEKPQSIVKETAAIPSKTLGVGSPFAKIFSAFNKSSDIGKGLSGKELQRLQKNYQNYFKEVAAVYNVSEIVDANKLPELKVDSQLLEQYSADALYDIENNQIIVSEELQKALASSTSEMMNKYSEILEGLTHEIQHALTLDFGELSLADVGLGLSPVKLKGYHDVSAYAQVQGMTALDQGSPDMNLPEAKGMLAAELNAYDSEQYTKGILENLVAQDTYESVFDNEDFNKEKEAFKNAIDDLEKLFSEGLNRLTKAVTDFAKGVSEKVTSAIGGFLTGNRTRKDPMGRSEVQYATVTANSRYLRRSRVPRQTYQAADIDDPWEEAASTRTNVVAGTTPQMPKLDPRGIGQKLKVRVRKPLANTVKSAQRTAEQSLEAFNNRLDDYVEENITETLTEVANLAGQSLDPSNLPKIQVDNAATSKAGKDALYNAKKHQLVISSRMRDLLRTNPEALEKYSKELKPLVSAARKAIQSNVPAKEAEEFAKQSGAVYARISTRAKGRRSNMPAVIKEMSEGIDGAIDALALGAKETAALKRKAQLYLQSLKKAARTPDNVGQTIASTGKSGGLEALMSGDIKGFMSKSPFSTNNSMQSLGVALGQRRQQPFGASPEQGQSTWERISNRLIPKGLRERGQQQRERLQQMYFANPKLPKNLNQLSDQISQKFKIPIDLYARLNIKGLADTISQVQKIIGKELDTLQEKAAALPFLGDMASKAVGGLKLLNVAGVGAGVTFLRFFGVLTRFTALNALAAQVQLVALQFDGLRKSFISAANEGNRSAEAFDRVMQSASELGVDKATAATGATEIFGNVTPKMGTRMAEQLNRAAQESALIYSSTPQQTEQIFSAFGNLTQESTLSMGNFQQLMRVMPGSLDTAARSMGMTNAEFQNFIQNNTVLVEDFLPRFIQQLNVDNQPRLAGAMDTLTTATNKYNNAIVDMQLEVGKTLTPVEKLRVQTTAFLAETVGKWGAGIFAKWGLSMAFLGAVKFAIQLKNVIAALLPIFLKLPIAQIAIAGLGIAIKHALPLILKMSAEFFFFQIAVDAFFSAWKVAFGNAGGQFTTWAETSANNIAKMSEAFDKASKSAEEFKNSLPTDEKDLQATGSRFEDTLIGSIFGKKNVRNAEGWIDKQFKKVDPAWKSYAQMEMYDKEEAVQNIRDSGGVAVQKVLDLRMGKDNSLREMTTLDKQLDTIRMKRRALATTNPNDITGLRELREQERSLLTRKDVVATPIAAAQSAIASQIKTYEDAIAKIDDEARKGAWTQEAYDRATQGLRTSLTEAEKAQKYLNSQIKDSTTALQALQRNFQLLNAQLADNASILQKNYNSTLKGIFANADLSSAQKQFEQMAAEQDLLGQKLKANKQTAFEMRESLAAQGGEDILTNYKVDVATTDTQGFQLLAQRAEAQGNAKEQEVFTQYARIKELELETSEMEVQVVQRQSEAQQQLKDLNKQVEEYYRGIARSAAESEIQIAKQLSELDNQQFANQVNAAMLGVGDNIISQFVGSLLDAINQIAQAADSGFDAQSQILQAQNTFEDTFRSGEELRKQLPVLSISGELPKLEVEVDLTTVGASADVKALNSEIDKGVSATQDLDKATQDFNTTVADSGGLIANNTSATNELESATTNVAGAMDTTKAATDNLNTAVNSTTDSASFLQGQIDANTVSTDQTNVAAQAVGTTLDANTQKTAANVEQTSIWFQWLGTKGVGGSLAGVLDSIGKIGNGIMDNIAKTVDWFKTFANNQGILNQIGQTISNFGNSMGEAVESGKGWLGDRVEDGKQLMGLGGGAVTDAAKKVIEVAKSWVGKEFAPGLREQCANFVRNVLKQAGLGDKIGVTKEAIDGLESGSALASGFFGKDIGKIIKDKNEAKAGDLVAFMGTYGGYGKDTITHVGVYAGDNMIYDRSTSSKPVMHRSLDTFGKGNYVFVRPHAYGDKGGKDQLKTAQTGAFGGTLTGMNTMLAQMDKEAKASPAAQKVASGARDYTKLPKEENIQAIVSEAIKAGVRDKAQIAYIVATAMHESGEFRLVQEQGPRSYFNQYEGDVQHLGNTQAGDGYRFRGHGFTQLTGRRNFEKQSRRMGLDLVNNPNLLADPSVSANVLVSGMVKGEFTGNKLSQYIGNGKVDISNARRTVNGYAQDQVNKVNEQYYKIFPQIDKYIANAGKGGAPMPSGQGTPQVYAPPQGQSFKPAPTMQVWSPASLAASGNARVSQTQDTAQQQRDAQIAVAARQQVVRATTDSQQGLQKGYQVLIQVEKQLRQSGYETRDLFEDIEKMNLDALGPLDSADKRKQALQDLERQFRDSGEKVKEKLIDVQNRRTSAKEILDQPDGIITPEVREKLNKVLSLPIAEDLKTRIQEAMTTGVFGGQLRNLLERSVSQADQEIATLQKASQALETGKQGALKAAQERFDFEEKARAAAAKFEQEGLNIATLQARLEQTKGRADREGQLSDAAKQIPALEALISLRQNQLDYDKQIQELEEKKRNKTINATEADNQIKTIQAKKTITEQTIKENKAYQEIVNTRAKDARNREAGLEQAKAELAVQKQQLEALKALPQTDARRSQIPLLEYQIELQELQLKLQEEIASVNDTVFKGDRSKAEGDARIAKLKEEFSLNQKNLGTRLKQATVEQELAQQRAILGIREQELGYSQDLLEAQSRSIELGRSTGDTLGARYDLQAKQQSLSFEKQVLDVKELALESGKSAEEIASIEAQLRKVNDIKLDNIKGELEKAFSDRAFAVQQRLGESGNSLLSAKQSLLSTYGFTQEASRIGKEIAVNQQGMDFANQRRELDEFIKTNAVAADKAALLRENLQSVNDIKFREIEAQFNPLKGVIDSSVGALKGGIKSLIKDGKLDFDSFFDGILDSIADFLSNMLVEQLMGFLSPKKDKMLGGDVFPNATADPNANQDFTSLLGIGDDPLGDLGKTAVTPMYVNVVNSKDLSFAQGANNIVPFDRANINSGLNFGGLFGSNEPDYISATTNMFGDLGGLFSPGLPAVSDMNPFPVALQKAQPDIFSNILGGGNGGGISNLIGGVANSIGGGGGIGSLIGTFLPIIGSFLGFSKGGVIGSGTGERDDQLILAQRGEAILSHRGLRTLGGVTALNALNRGVSIPRFATGGVIGEYGGSGAADAVERGKEDSRRRSNEPIKLETTIINNTEYATTDQVRSAMQEARSMGAKDGVTYVQNKMENSVTWRNRYGVRS